MTSPTRADDENSLARTEERPTSSLDPRPAKRILWIPLAIYLLSRVVTFGAMQIASQFPDQPGGWQEVARQWDGLHYVNLATEGYPSALTIRDGEVGTSVHAFFPAYPLLIRAVNLATGVSPTMAAVSLSLLLGGVFAVEMWWIADRLGGRRVAEAAVLLLCFFPGSLFFNWAYPESLMLALVAGSFLCILDRRLITAGVLAGLATATRPNALPIVLVFVWLTVLAIRRRESPLRAGFATLLSVTGFALFNLYLWGKTDVATAWFRVEREGFQEGVRPGQVTLRTLGDAVESRFRSIPAMLTVVFVLIGLGLIVMTLRSALPGWMRFFAVVGVVSAFTAAVAPSSLRLQLAAFPAFVPLAERLRGPALSCATAVSASLLVVLVLAYGNFTRPPFHMWAP